MSKLKKQINMKNSKGMTLIELMLVMLMIGFILTIGYSMYFLGVKSYTIGINRSDAQYECRKAVQSITKTAQSAGANKVNLVTTYDNQANYKYFYIDTDNLLRYDDGTTNTPAIIAGVANKLTFATNPTATYPPPFSCPSPSILRINLTCLAVNGNNTQPYNITTDIKILNNKIDYTGFTHGSTNYPVLLITN